MFVFLVMMAKEKPPITVVGDVGGRIAIIVVRNWTSYQCDDHFWLMGQTMHVVSVLQDDIIDDVEDFVATAEILKERGAYKIYVMATHGLLSADAPRLIEESAIDEVSLSARLECTSNEK